MRRVLLLTTLVPIIAVMATARAQQPPTPLPPMTIPLPPQAPDSEDPTEEAADGECNDPEKVFKDAEREFKAAKQVIEERKARLTTATTNRAARQKALEKCQKDAKQLGLRVAGTEADCADEQRLFDEAIAEEKRAQTLAATSDTGTYKQYDEARSIRNACRKAREIAKKQLRPQDPGATAMPPKPPAPEAAKAPAPLPPEPVKPPPPKPQVVKAPEPIPDTPQDPPPTDQQNVPGPKPDTADTGPPGPGPSGPGPGPAGPGGGRSAGPIPPPPLLPPRAPLPPAPPTWERTADGGMTCRYRDGASSWSFTTWDKEIIAGGCPVIPPGYSPVRPPSGTPSPAAGPGTGGTPSAGGAPARGGAAGPSPGSGGGGPATPGSGGTASGPGSGGGSTPATPPQFGQRPDTGAAGALPPVTIPNPPSSPRPPTNVASANPQGGTAPAPGSSTPTGPSNTEVTELCFPTKLPDHPFLCAARDMRVICAPGTKGTSCPAWTGPSTTMLCDDPGKGEVNKATCRPAKCEMKLRKPSDPNSRYTECQPLGPATAAKPPVLAPIKVATPPLPPAKVAPPAPKPAAPLPLTDSCAGGHVFIDCKVNGSRAGICSRPEDVNMHLKDRQRHNAECTVAGKPAPQVHQKAAVTPAPLPVIALPQRIPAAAPAPHVPPQHTPAPPVVMPPPEVPTPAPPPAAAAPPPAEQPAEEEEEKDDAEDEPEEQAEEESAPSPMRPAHRPRPPRRPTMPSHQPSAGAPHAPVYVPRIVVPRIVVPRIVVPRIVVPHIPRISPHVSPRITHRPPRLTHRPPVHHPRVVARPPVHRPTIRVAPRIVAPRVQVHRPQVHRPPVHRPQVRRR